MPTAPTYPGVYIEELPSGVRTITGVSTSVTAFVGYLTRGPLDEAVTVYNWGEFERKFGGLHRDSEVSYAIQQFFLNGGTEAVVIRVASSSTKPVAASVTLATADGTAALVVSAASEGKWGNAIRLDVDYDAEKPDEQFNLTVAEYSSDTADAFPLTVETFRNLSILKNDPNYVVDVVNSGSDLIQMALAGGFTPGNADTDRPAQTGTAGNVDVVSNPLALNSGDQIDVTYGGKTDVLTIGTGIDTPRKLRNELQAKLRGLTTNLPELENAVIQITNNRLLIRPGVQNPDATLSFADNTGTAAADLGLDAGNAVVNVQQYWLGKGVVAGMQTAVTAGTDGDKPGSSDLTGKRDPDKTGMYALEDVDIFNILCIPYTAELSDSEATNAISKALAYCEERRAFMIVDIPDEDDWEVEDIQEWVDDNSSTLRHKNAALYYPRISIADPLNGYRDRPVGTSGMMAGLYARTDSTRGVWKAPAGTEAVLRGLRKLNYKLTDPQNGALNPLAINCLRTFPIYGNVSWGARTMVGSDQQASQWKYVPVRRLALYIEESLYRGTQWVVFEPNDEPLWSQIRMNVRSFMQTLFRQGAFQGSTPKEAYLVKCDSETTTQNDIDRGIVNILVGFAPLKPAEFVIIKISQLTREEA